MLYEVYFSTILRRPFKKVIHLIIWLLYLLFCIIGCNEDQSNLDHDLGDEIGGHRDEPVNDLNQEVISAGEPDAYMDMSLEDTSNMRFTRDMSNFEQIPENIDAGNLAEEELLYNPDLGPIHDINQLISVDTTIALLNAIEVANPGDVISLEPGVYSISQLVTIRKDGEPNSRIFMRAATLGSVTLELSHIENFKLYGKFWIFENLRIVGVCDDEQGCEHAFHIVGDADDIIFRNNEVINFASHIKLNGERLGEEPAKSFPDRIMFINNFWHNTKYIRNNVPHNILNLDGGHDHVVRGNIFADYNTPADLPKSASAIYPKASTHGILIEQNLIVCEKQRTEGETARGVQLGDGAPSSICDGDMDQDGEGDCIERGQSQEAIVRNNIIMRCDNGGSATGIMVGSDRDSQILHNTVSLVGQRNAGFYQGHPNYDTYWRANILERGINTQYAERPLNTINNFVPSSEELSNIFATPSEGDFTLINPILITDQIPTDPSAPHDFCGYPRGAFADIGAIEYSTTYLGSSCVDKVLAMYNRIP
jgi:hypothetical protein